MTERRKWDEGIVGRAVSLVVDGGMNPMAASRAWMMPYHVVLRACRRHPRYAPRPYVKRSPWWKERCSNE